MKPLNPFESRLWFQALTVVLVLATVLWAAPLMAAPATQSQSAMTNSPRSAFVLPANPGEGRDPFFPKSNRPYETAMTATNNAVEVTALVVRGISGSPDHRLVIINNHTFAAGDIADVIMDQGRIRVHCVEIKPRSVIIEVGNQYHELPISDNP
ncbi:MAG TPA: hypothetical protein VN836_08680 [Verrucomicrobiae bacterium]|nr:hypothetical protein [Verrucomicrobiae bacterium]